MADFQNQKERIKTYISHIGLSNLAFEKSIGLSNGYINSMRKGIGYDVLEQLSNTYKDLNMGWLIIGEGSMLKSNDGNNVSPINVDSDLNTIEMERKIKRLEASIDALIEKNERLEAELSEYKAKEVQSKGVA